MLPDKAIERFILVNRPYHVVPEGPEIVDNPVLLESHTLPETHHVQPVPTPTFAIVRGGQQAVDQFLVGLGIGVIGKGIYLPGTGRQAGQIISGPANQAATTGLGIHGQAVLG